MSKQKKDVYIHICAECGKEFYIGDSRIYTYKRQDPEHNYKMAYYCGWNCFRKFEKRNGIDRNGKKTEIV